MRNFEDITSPKHLQKLDSVVSPSPQDPTSTKVVITISTPVEHPSIPARATPAVVSPSTQGHPSLYDCENTLQQVATSFIEADALRISETQVSSSLDFVKHSICPLKTTSHLQILQKLRYYPSLNHQTQSTSIICNNTTKNQLLHIFNIQAKTFHSQHVLVHLSKEKRTRNPLSMTIYSQPLRPLSITKECALTIPKLYSKTHNV